PDGSAVAGCVSTALVWRPEGEGFRAISHPDASGARIVGVALPSPDRAWVATLNGLVFEGTLHGKDWSWKLENVDLGGTVVGRGPDGSPGTMRALAVDAGGHGYAVGDKGLVLERTGDGDQPWRRLKTGFLDDLTAVALDPS